MTSVVMIVKVIKHFRLNDEYFIRCYDDGFFIKCKISKEQFDYLSDTKNKKSLYIITGYYIKYKRMIIIKVDTIKSFDYKKEENMCNFNNKKYDLSVMQNFEQIKERKVSNYE